jgi:hypothetical protein
VENPHHDAPDAAGDERGDRRVFAGGGAVHGFEVEVRGAPSRRARRDFDGEELRATTALAHLKRLAHPRAFRGRKHAAALGMGLRQAIRALRKFHAAQHVLQVLGGKRRRECL